MLTGQNGILNKAVTAKEKTGVAQEEESERLQGYEDTINQFAPSSNGGISGGGTTGEESLPTGTGTTPYLPDEEKFEKLKDTDLSTGLVIKEKATGSEYVWVEVPRTEAVYPTAGVDITSFKNEEYTKIETDLHTYTHEYKEGLAFNFNDVYYPDSTTGWFEDENKYDDAKKKMLKSVYQNGGFWVGRYEAGIEDEANTRTSYSPDEITLIPVTKQNMYPYIYLNRTQAKVAAEKVEAGRYTSSLMFGVQWDLVLKYIETKKATTKDNLKTNSTQIGNYYDSEFMLYRGKFAEYERLSAWSDHNPIWYNFDGKDKPDLVERSQKKQTSSLNPILLTTGATEATKLQNIYDIAGNVWEFTLEYVEHDYPCVQRGGSCQQSGSECNASYRSVAMEDNSEGDLGFRISIY